MPTCSPDLCISCICVFIMYFPRTKSEKEREKKTKKNNKLKNHSEISTVELVQMRSLLCTVATYTLSFGKKEPLASSWFIPIFMSAPSFLDYNKFVVAKRIIRNFYDFETAFAMLPFQSHLRHLFLAKIQQKRALYRSHKTTSTPDDSDDNNRYFHLFNDRFLLSLALSSFCSARPKLAPVYFYAAWILFGVISCANFEPKKNIPLIKWDAPSSCCSLARTQQPLYAVTIQRF